MIIGKDEKGTIHVVVGPQEIAEGLPALVAEALAEGCQYNVDTRADVINKQFLEELERYDRGRTGVL